MDQPGPSTSDGSKLPAVPAGLIHGPVIQASGAGIQPLGAPTILKIPSSNGVPLVPSSVGVSLAPNTFINQGIKTNVSSNPQPLGQAIFSLPNQFGNQQLFTITPNSGGAQLQPLLFNYVPQASANSTAATSTITGLGGIASPLVLATNVASGSLTGVPTVNINKQKPPLNGRMKSPLRVSMDDPMCSKDMDEEMGEVTSHDTGEYNEEDMRVSYDDPEFVWDEYLEATGAHAVPPTAFKHVECSLQSGFIKGMKLEVPNKCIPDTFWVASVVLTCDPLLRLRFEGYEEDSSADFWCDLSTSEIHPIGWCASQNKILQPPEAVKNRYSDWREFLMKSLTGAKTAPPYLLDKAIGSNPIAQIKRGMKLEIQDLLNPTMVWLVDIIENVGGRLYLRYVGLESAGHDFWLFYLDCRLHPPGWASARKYEYKPPEVLWSAEGMASRWREILVHAKKAAFDWPMPSDIFKDQIEIETHRFQAGWKLEAFNPESRSQMCPATIVRVINKNYFMVEIDSLESDSLASPIQFSCHAKSPFIFPVHWCQSNGIRLVHPKGWPKSDFVWEDYLTIFQAEPVPRSCFDLDDMEHDFTRAMKLEAVNPENQNQICAATISKIVGPLMWIHLDNITKASHITSIFSYNLFPVGWCESNGYQLKPPRKSGVRRTHKQVAIVQPKQADGNLTGEDFRSETYSQIKNGDAATSWCPKIYFNHRCFSGPYLSKGRIAELPKSVGPGPIALVMKEVLTMLINVAYKSSRVLREIQLDGTANPSMNQQVLKAKYQGKSYCAVVEVCKEREQLDEFCRLVCIKLECCPNLVSPNFIDNNECPENCSQLTKTKYTYYYGKKKKKVGRPPGGHSNIDTTQKKPGRKRKRKTINLIQRKLQERQASGEGKDISDNSESSEEPTLDSITEPAKKKPRPKFKSTSKLIRKRKYNYRVPTPSDIRTRGAKLPKYNFERKTHKKIMLNPCNSSQSKRLSHIQHRAAASQESPIYQEEILQLESNPLEWSVSDVVDFIKTTDCDQVSRLFREQEIDGQALLLLTLPAVQEHLDMKLGPAIKLCHHIERVKIAFYELYAK